MEYFSVNKVRCDKWEILQICCKERFKRTGKFEGTDNVIAGSIPSAGRALRMCLPGWPLNAVHIYIYAQVMQWGRICWRDWFLPGALPGRAACCGSFYHSLVVVTALLALASPLRQPNAGSKGSLGARELLLFARLHRLWFVLCLMPSSSRHTFISLRPSKNGTKRLPGYSPRSKSLVCICSRGPFLLYKRYLWGFSAAFMSVGNIAEV